MTIQGTIVFNEDSLNLLVPQLHPTRPHATARTYTDPAEQSGIFHTVSLITWRTRCLLDEERDYFVRCLRAWAAC